MEQNQTQTETAAAVRSKDLLAAHLVKWQDLCAGIALLYAGPEGNFDDLTDRLRAAMESNNMVEMSHVSAVMLTTMVGRGQDVSEPSKWWGNIDRDFHANYCQDPICIERRQAANVES
jgi:hypothetical protein